MMRALVWLGTAIGAVGVWWLLDRLLQFAAFGIFWKVKDRTYLDASPDRSFSESWAAARADFADLIGPWGSVAISVLAALLLVRLGMRLRTIMQSSEARPRPAPRSAPAIDILDELNAPSLPELDGAWEHAVAIERVFPPPPTGPGLTFIGGLPLAGPDFAWPRGPKGVPSFVAQVAMADLSDMPTRPLFPRDGVLHFFLPPLGGDSFAEDGFGPLVVHDKGHGPRSEIAPPPDLPPHGDGTLGREGPWPLRLRQVRSGAARGALYPRHAVRLRPCARDEAPAALPDFPGLPDRSGIGHLPRHYAEAEAHRTGKLIGPPRPAILPGAPPLGTPWRPDAGFPSDWLQIDVLACALVAQIEKSMGAYRGLLRTLAETGRVSVSHRMPLLPGAMAQIDRNIASQRNALAEADAKGDAKAIEITRAQLAAGERQRDAVRQGEMPHSQSTSDPAAAQVLEAEIACHGDLLAKARAWMDRAQRHLEDGPVNPAMRDRFWTWWSETTAGQVIHPSSYAHGPIASGSLNRGDDAIRDALRHAAEERLNAGGAVPDALVAGVREWHVPGARPDGGGHGRHRIGGDPSVVQEAGIFMIRTHVLLLQLEHDNPMGWRFGDVGVFQWWIRPDDLAARRWDRVELIFEGH